MIARKSRLLPGKPPPRKNVKRRKRLFKEDFHSAAYVKYIRSLPCALCGVEGYSEAAHVRSRGAGGKASDIVPLCGPHDKWRLQSLYIGCHRMYDEGRLDKVHFGILQKYAAELWAAFQENRE